MRANEAAALAEVVFQQVEGRRLNDDLRHRAAGRAGSLGLETIVPHMGSLQSDPIHPNCYFVAIDAVRGGIAKPYLLRLASASAPSSGTFQKSILIGRMRPGGGREIVINTVPFGPEDRDAIRTFAREVDRGFLPKPSGNAFNIASSDPEAFASFRSILLESSLNVAAYAGDWHSGVLQAIRAGWREGYAIASPPIVLKRGVDPLDSMLRLTGYTKLVIDVAQLDAAHRKDAVAMAFDALVKANAAEHWTWKRPDLELSWGSSASATTADEIAMLAAELKESGRSVQAVSPRFGESWSASVVDAVRGAGAAITLDSVEPALSAIAHACGGRVHCNARRPGEDLRALVKTLRS